MDLRTSIGMFGLYSPWIPYYEVRILYFCMLFSIPPLTGLTQLVLEDVLEYHWEKDHGILLEELKK